MVGMEFRRCHLAVCCRREWWDSDSGCERGVFYGQRGKKKRRERDRVTCLHHQRYVYIGIFQSSKTRSHHEDSHKPKRTKRARSRQTHPRSHEPSHSAQEREESSTRAVMTAKGVRMMSPRSGLSWVAKGTNHLTVGLWVSHPHFSKADCVCDIATATLLSATSDGWRARRQDLEVWGEQLGLSFGWEGTR